MASKLKAATMAVTAGENVIIASGKQPGTLARILAGESVGTLFVAQGESYSSWKRWLGLTAQPRGRLVVDDGARRAIEHQGRSLLAIGIVSVEGTFRKGDVVSLNDSRGEEFARGLSNYAAEEIQRIKGLKTDQIATALGHCPHDEVIHRDHLARGQGSGGRGPGKEGLGP